MSATSSTSVSPPPSINTTVPSKSYFSSPLTLATTPSCQPNLIRLIDRELPDIDPVYAIARLGLIHLTHQEIIEKTPDSKPIVYFYTKNAKMFITTAYTSLSTTTPESDLLKLRRSIVKTLKWLPLTSELKNIFEQAVKGLMVLKQSETDVIDITDLPAAITKVIINTSSLSRENLRSSEATTRGVCIQNDINFIKMTLNSKNPDTVKLRIEAEEKQFSLLQNMSLDPDKPEDTLEQRLKATIVKKWDHEIISMISTLFTNKTMTTTGAKDTIRQIIRSAPEEFMTFNAELKEAIIKHLSDLEQKAEK